MNSNAANRPVGEEARKSVRRQDRSGFYAKYLSGSAILDIGYRGYLERVVPIVPGAVGVELDYSGHDGIKLPFPDSSQDAVFASDCLEHISDWRNAISDWFRVLRIGGFLVIMVPHQFLYEKKAALPSRYNQEHKRFYTPASLMAEVEQALKPNTYRLRHLVDNDDGFDDDLPPTQHSGGSYEIEIVIEKIRSPAWELAEPPHMAEIAHDPGAVEPGATIQAQPVALYDFGSRIGPAPRILVLKLDHLGDFIIGLPALRRLRDAFPAGHIRLVVGSWNRIAAEASGLVDQVVTYDYFPQSSQGWDGIPLEPVDKFRALTRGRFDLAIDLRVDADTRWLLHSVDAGIRCGIGGRARFPFLDVAMPPEHADRGRTSDGRTGRRWIGLNQFESRMPIQRLFYHETSFAAEKLHMIFGPNTTLPPGSFKAVFDLELTGWPAGMRRASVTLDVARDGAIGAIKRFRIPALRQLRHEPAEVSFTNEDPAARYEFRVFVEGGSSRAGVRFRGVWLEHLEAPVEARLRPAALHIGEQLSMLVQLVADRVQLLYPDVPRAPSRNGKHVVIAPLSNKELRDWPSRHYVALIRMLLEIDGCRVSLVGAPQQASALEEIARQTESGARIVNLAGRTAWSEMPALLRNADLVICNNSGIAHAAAAAGAETLAIYSASHQPQEWGPRGERSHAIMAKIACSPCGFDRLQECPHEHACMVGLTPASVFSAASRLLSGAGRIAATAQAGT